VDFKSIVRIGNQHRRELGQILLHNLRTGVSESSLIVAQDKDDKIIGFILWHQRHDGWNTIYDIAVAKDWLGYGVGRLLFSQVNPPRQLKVAADNKRARNFYESFGLKPINESVSRTGRRLILYQEPTP
jgi:ribosomal protein S18 acetylase RimI-like enzyme